MTATGRADLASLIGSRIRDVPDYPAPGVLFKDITPLLRDAPAFAATIDALREAMPAGTDVVAGVEARGFILGAPLAVAAGVGFVPIRKAGKLPARTLATSYQLEYGAAEIEVHADALEPGQRVVVLDDVLATGGTAAAACQLVEMSGAHVASLLFLLELDVLRGRSTLAERPVTSLLRV